MKRLTKKSQITAKNLKNSDCEYKGYRIGFDKKNGLYFLGSLFSSMVDYYETIKDIKSCI